MLLYFINMDKKRWFLVINRLKEAQELQKNAKEQLENDLVDQKIYGSDHEGLAIKVSISRQSLERSSEAVKKLKDKLHEMNYTLKELLLDLVEFPNNSKIIKSDMFNRKVKDVDFIFKPGFEDNFQMKVRLDNNEIYDLSFDREKIVPRSVKEKLFTITEQNKSKEFSYEPER